MEDIKKIAVDLFGITEMKPSRSGGAHEISIFSKVDRSGFPDMLPDDFSDLAKYIDHTILKPEATIDEIKKVCEEAEEYKFRSVCVNPGNVKMAKSFLQTVDLCSVVGFPLGANTTKIKCAETELAIKEGAVEIDMVINLGLLKSRKYSEVLADIEAVCDVCHLQGAILKVIIETCLLTEREKIIACLLAKKAGADFVKTSTGFSGGGATVEDIKLMREIVGPKMGVKASGGVRTKEQALEMLRAGANRIGASSSLKIIGK